jgi:excisionase family DNA binding protein
MKYKYKDLKYSIRILNDGSGSYSVEVPKLPGCYSTGKDKEDCIHNAVEAIGLHLEGVKYPPEPDAIPEIQVVETDPTADDYLISLPEACKFLDISDATIRRYIKNGKIPAYNFGKEYKFKISELTNFVDSTRVNGKSEPRKTG